MLAPGWVLGRYEILRLLSVGGMAEIYLARAAGIAGFEKRVVIKRMLPHFAAHQTFVDMFLSEARLAATLDHPNIVQVYDIGESTGDYYYAMEYVPGVDLRAIVGEERRFGRMVPIAMATAIARGMCAGLDHAHSRTGHDGGLIGIVHRDVSLSNILVSYDGAVKVTDFGVAKVATSGNRTRAGMLKGKLGYMSPEQVCSEPLDRRSDVFGIGIVLWELLGARRLFVGDAEFAVLQRIVHGIVPPPSTIRADVPAELEAIVMRALAREREERYQTAREMQRDLEAFARDRRLAISDIELGEYMSHLFPATHDSDTIDYDPDGDGESMKVAVAEPVAVPHVSWRRHAEAQPVGAPPTAYARYKRSGVAALAVLSALGVGAWAAVAGGGEPVPTAGIVERVAANPAAAPAMAPTPTPAAPTPAEITPLPEPAPVAAAAAAVPEMTAPLPSVPAVPAPRKQPPPPPRKWAPAPAAPVRRNLAAAAPAPAAPAPIATGTLRPAPAPAAVTTPPAVSPAPIEPAPAPTPRVTMPSRPAPLAPPPPKTGALDAIPAIRTVDVSGGLQSSVVRRGVERALDGYRACYRSAARTANRTPEGQVKLTFEIDESGMVGDVHAAGLSLPGLASCMQQATSRLRSRVTPDVGVAHATVVITFEPVEP